VIAGRLSWLFAELQLGRSARISVNTTAEAITVNYKLAPANPESSSDNSLAMLMTLNLMQSLNHFVAVDHGHQKSNGYSQVSIKLRPRCETLQVHPTHPARPSIEVEATTGETATVAVAEAATTEGKDEVAEAAAEPAVQQQVVSESGHAETTVNPVAAESAPSPFGKGKGEQPVFDLESERAAKSVWEADPINMPDGTRVVARFTWEHRTGVVLRSGFGPYEDQYRVKFDVDSTDRWVDKWRCLRADM